MLLVGLLLVRLTLADVYQRYVRVEMGPWLLIAGVLLIGLGTVAVTNSTQPAPARDAWLTVIGTFRSGGTDGVPELDATSTQLRDAPSILTNELADTTWVAQRGALVQFGPGRSTSVEVPLQISRIARMWICHRCQREGHDW